MHLGDTTFAFDISNSNYLNTKTLHRDLGLDSLLWIQSIDGLQKSSNFSIEYNTLGCYPISVSGFSAYHKNYKKGCGLFSGGSYSTFSNQVYQTVYYNKNGVTWGTPLNIDDLVSTQSLTQKKYSINVFPNPTSNILSFLFDEPIDDAEIRIYSSIGKLMINQAIRNTTMEFDVSDWNNGVYHYGIYAEGRLVKQGQVLVNE